MKIVSVFLLLCLFICSCGEQKTKKELTVIDLEKSVPDESLKISDIIDHVRLVRLETRSEALLPGFFYACVGDKYIVTLGQEEIHLFTADGKYIRKLAEHGRGPEEYLYVLGFCMDEQQGRLYLSGDDNRICVIDLNVGKIIQKLPTIGGTPHEMLLTGIDTLTYIPIAGVDKGEAYDICRMKTDGTFIDGIRGINRGNAAGMPYLGMINDTLCYKMGLCDTLYRMENSVRIPECRIVTDRPYSMQTGQGRAVELAFENKDLYILTKTEMETKTEGDMMYSGTEFLGYYRFGKADNKLTKINDFYLDLLDYTYTDRFPFIVSGNRVYRNLNVSQFKEMLKDKLDSPLIADSLKTLYHELADDDNSLLLIGEIKQEKGY